LPASTELAESERSRGFESGVGGPPTPRLRSFRATAGLRRDRLRLQGTRFGCRWTCLPGRSSVKPSEVWLGGRDSNPETLVQRADQPRRCAVIRIVSGRSSRRAFRPPPSISMRFCSTCLFVSHPARPLAAGLSGSRLAAPNCRYAVRCRPTQRFEQDQRSEHESADHPLDFADSVSRRRPSIDCSGKPVQHVDHNTSVALHNTFVVSCLR